MCKNIWKKLCVIKHDPLLPNFEDVYKVCGGNMFLLKMYLEYVKLNWPRFFFLMWKTRHCGPRTVVGAKQWWSLQWHKLGKSIVDSLVANNSLHLRPTKCFSHHLPFQAKNTPILTPETIAMEWLLAQMNKQYWISEQV